MKSKRLLSILLTVVMVVALLPITASAAGTYTANTYGDLQTEAAKTSGESANDVIQLGQDITNGTTQLTIGRSLTLDLAGKNLTINLDSTTGKTSNGIKLNSGVTLTIIDSSNPSAGKLTVTNGATEDTHDSGKGAAINTTNGTLKIQSGTVNATGGYRGAGIGGGNGGGGGNITISGSANVTATGGEYGAGIGSGYIGGNPGDGGVITINGGTVKAYGGTSGAGIGGGGNGGAGGDINISGGMVVATGGARSGAGIGGGSLGGGGVINISGGTVEATGGAGETTPIAFGAGAGIGGGGGMSGAVIGNVVASGDSGNITISGDADVTATGGDGANSGALSGHAGAGIGSGGGASGGTGGDGASGSLGDIVITSTGTGTVTATGGDGNGANGGAAIGTGGDTSGAGQSYIFVSTAEQLTDALSNAPDMNIIKLLNDITTTSQISLDGKAVALDLNDYTLTVSRAGQTAISMENAIIITANTGSDTGKLIVNGNIVASGGYGGYMVGGLYVMGDTGDVEVTVGGDITVTGDANTQVYGMMATGANVTVDGDITATAPGENGTARGVWSIGDATIDVSGRITVTGGDAAYGVLAENHSDVTVDGDVSAEATDADSEACGVDARNGTVVEVGGDVSADAVSIACGVSSAANGGESATVTVTGDVTAMAYDYASGVMTEDAEVTVGGNVTATAESEDALGITAMGDTTIVEAGGNITATAANGKAVGVNTYNGAEVTIEGTITASGDTTMYITFDGSAETAEMTDQEKAVARAAVGFNGYFEYTDDTSYVWVRDPATVQPNATFAFHSGELDLAKTPTDWVFKTDDFALLAGLDFAALRFENASEDGYNIYPVGGNQGNGEIAGLEYDSATGELTVPTPLATHAQTSTHGALPPGNYKVIITFVDDIGNPTVYFDYEVQLTLTKNPAAPPPPSSGNGGSTTQSNYITVNTVSVNYSKGGGSLTTDITAQTLRNIVDKAFTDADGSRTIKLDYSGVSNADKLTLTFDASRLKANEDITFIVETTFGAFIFTTEQMLEWFGGKEFGKYTITLEKSSLKVDIKKDGKSAAWNKLTPMARIGVPYTLKSGENAANLVVTDKGGRVLPTSVYEQGMVYADIFALGTYKVTAATPDSFSDTAGSWAKADIDYVTLRGLISGAGGAFSPGTAITRADFIAAFVKLAGVDVSGYRQSRYSDVSGADMPYIEWASEMGIVFGVGGGLFQPERSISREEMAVMMYRYADVLGYPLPVLVDAERFGDAASISDWASNAVAAMQRTGIVVGKPGGVFDPKGTFTRAESAAVLHRFVELVISSRDAEGFSNANNDLSKRVFYTQNAIELTGWQTINGDKYYFDDKGIMTAGKWVQISGKWYYFNDDGTPATNTTVDGYEVGADGARK